MGKRKRVHKKGRKSNKKFTREDWIGLFVVAMAIFLIIKFISMPLANVTGIRKNCPYEVKGSDNPILTIQYVDSITCFWCWIEKPILDALVEEHNTVVRLESYDINQCSNLTEKHGFYGTPSFVFKMRGDPREMPHTGFIEEERLQKIVCEATGEC